jgi:CRISPR-associated protein (TIGR03986 family)
LIHRGSQWSIQPAETIFGASFARISIGSAGTGVLRKWHGIPNAKESKFTFLSVCPHSNLPLVETALTGGVQGVRVKTGPMQGKKLDCVFGLPDFSQAEIPIPYEIIAKYREQITKGQQDFLEESNSALRHMQPVFYIVENRELVFFGHAMMFRLPCLSSVRDFILSQLRSFIETRGEEISDLAEAIFGYSREKEKGINPTYKGRLFFSDAHCLKKSTEDIWLTNDEAKVINPKILSSPKPTTFQHYLVQPKETDAASEKLKHYPSKLVQETVIRGHKLYWKKAQVTRQQIEACPEDVRNADSQYTEIKPIKAGISFKFRIYFENLNKVELGALLWVLDIAQDKKYRLSLGMGKPLGMGAVEITHELYLNQRQDRYQKLFDGQQWFTGYADTPALTEPYINKFDTYIRNKIGAAEASLKEVRRIKMLLAMLSWDEAPPSDQTRYMEIERDASKPYIGNPRNGKVNEYAERPVLPTPLQVIGWEQDVASEGKPIANPRGKTALQIAFEEAQNQAQNNEEKQRSQGR